MLAQFGIFAEEMQQQIANNNNQAQYLEYMKDRMSKIHHGL